MHQETRPRTSARGVEAEAIHVGDIDTVINFDIPNEPETYVHRVGRTGRAGATGTDLSLRAADEREQLASIERLIRRKIQKLETPSPLPATRGNQPAARRERGHRQQSRRRSGSGASSRRRSRGRDKG
jgi:ATP-dependent RNA helicase RhlE